MFKQPKILKKQKITKKYKKIRTNQPPKISSIIKKIKQKQLKDCTTQLSKNSLKIKQKKLKNSLLTRFLLIFNKNKNLN